jgi:hypothetical protein
MVRNPARAYFMELIQQYKDASILDMWKKIDIKGIVWLISYYGMIRNVGKHYDLTMIQRKIEKISTILKQIDDIFLSNISIKETLERLNPLSRIIYRMVDSLISEIEVETNLVKKLSKRVLELHKNTIQSFLKTKISLYKFNKAFLYVISPFQDMVTKVSVNKSPNVMGREDEFNDNFIQSIPVAKRLNNYANINAPRGRFPSARSRVLTRKSKPASSRRTRGIRI